MKTTPAMKLKLALLFMVALCFNAISPAAELPDGAITSGVGVNIHFSRGHENDLDLIAKGGFKFIRMDFFWTDTERKKGVYDWSAYDELTANLEWRGLCAYYILDYSNPLYEETVDKNSGHEKVLASPCRPESVAAFVRWAGAAAKHFRSHHVIWEIWNEPNGSFWEPEANVKNYTTLVLATAKAVRTADPSATILAPATSGFPWPFLDQFLQSGVLEFLDGVSVHPYRSPNQPPETVAMDYERLRQIIATNTPATHKQIIPIISGEWGYSTCTKGVSLETQAAFAARQQLANSLNGVPISIWYDWKNDGDDPKENEHNFGTVRPDLSPKPAYTAIKTLTQELGGFVIEKQYPVANANDFVLVLTNAAHEIKLAAWTLDSPHSLALPIGLMKKVSTVNSENKTNEIISTNRQIQLLLSAAPCYVALGKIGLQ